MNTNTVPQVDPTLTLERVLDLLVDTKDEIARLEERRQDLETEAVRLMGDQASVVWEAATDSTRRQATVVRPTAVNIDETVLETAIPKKIWDSITTRKVDVKRFEAQVAVGNIPTEVAVVAVTRTERRPYVRITTKGR